MSKSVRYLLTLTRLTDFVEYQR